MGFNELNSVEHYIFHQLSGVNLNKKEVQEPHIGYGAQWVYKASDEIQLEINQKPDAYKRNRYSKKFKQSSIKI